MNIGMSPVGANPTTTSLVKPVIEAVIHIMDLRKLNEKIKVKQQEIDIAKNELLELEQEYQDDLQESLICGSQNPKSNSIRLQEWRIQRLYSQLRQLKDRFDDVINE